MPSVRLRMEVFKKHKNDMRLNSCTVSPLQSKFNRQRILDIIRAVGRTHVVIRFNLLAAINTEAGTIRACILIMTCTCISIVKTKRSAFLFIPCIQRFRRQKPPQRRIRINAT